MIKYISKRLLLLIPTLLGVVTIVFFMMSLAPGDPARLALGAHAGQGFWQADEYRLNRRIVREHGLKRRHGLGLDCVGDEFNRRWRHGLQGSRIDLTAARRSDLGMRFWAG